jgi:hypothetical protein
VKVDRSFATNPPPCIETIRQARVKGGSWAGVAIDLTEEVKTRDICLEEVSKWLAAERNARPTGAPGA